MTDRKWKIWFLLDAFEEARRIVDEVMLQFHRCEGAGGYQHWTSEKQQAWRTLCSVQQAIKQHFVAELEFVTLADRNGNSK